MAGALLVWPRELEDGAGRGWPCAFVVGGLPRRVPGDDSPNTHASAATFEGSGGAVVALEQA